MERIVESLGKFPRFYPCIKRMPSHELLDQIAFGVKGSDIISIAQLQIESIIDSVGPLDAVDIVDAIACVLGSIKGVHDDRRYLGLTNFPFSIEPLSVSISRIVALG